MNAFAYYNPVKIIFGQGAIGRLGQLIGSRRAILVTSKGFMERGVAQHIASEHAQIEQIMDTIPASPTFMDLRNHYSQMNHNRIEVIVALGGGSVIDSAKALSVYHSPPSYDLVERLIKQGNPFQEDQHRRIPIIAVPTTAGTGSEVTPWATVWDVENKRKYSLHLDDLWCEACICDPILTATMPRELTIQTALDAMSHSLESIWNKNANELSIRWSLSAAKDIIAVLPSLLKDLGNLSYREKMMLASLQAGLAFSNTKTAIAHAVSYYLTLHKNIPHGIACSFTLPDIMDTVCLHSPESYRMFSHILGDSPGRQLREWLEMFGVSTQMSHYGINRTDLEQLKDTLIGNERASNSIVDLERLFNLWYTELNEKTGCHGA